MEAPLHHSAVAEGAPSLWASVPLECYVCAAAIFLAAGLRLAGLMP